MLNPLRHPGAPGGLHFHLALGPTNSVTAKSPPGHLPPPLNPTRTLVSLRMKCKLLSGRPDPAKLVLESLLPSRPRPQGSSHSPHLSVAGSSHWLLLGLECGCLLRGALLALQLQRLSPAQVFCSPALTAEASHLLVYLFMVCLPHPHPGAQNVNRRAGSS